MIVIMVLSALLQFAAAYLSIRMIRITGRRKAWILIAAAITIGALRRSNELFRLVSTTTVNPPEVLGELFSLGTSICMVVGVALIAPLFQSVKKSEESLQKEKDLSEAVINSLPGIFYLFDDKKRIVRWNNNLEKITGFTAQEIATMHPEAFFPSTYKEYISKKVQEVFTQGTADVEADLLPRNGPGIPYYFSGRLFNSEGNKFIVGTGIDITARKRAEDEMNRAYTELHQIFNSAVDAMRLLDKDHNQIKVNNTFLNLLNIGESEVIGKKCYEMFHCPRYNTAFCAVARIVSGEERVEEEIVIERPDRDKIDCILTAIPHYDAAGNLIGIIEDFKDVTERKKMEEALRKSEERYRSLFEESKDVVFISTPEGNFVDMNPAGLELFGYSSKDEFLKIDLAKDLYFDPSARVKYRDMLELCGFVKDYEIELKRKDGKKLTVMSTSTSLRDEKGDIVAYRGIIRDITEYKRLEKQLLQAQKMEAVGQLAGGIAHDFNNILCTIMGYGSLVQNKMSENHPLRAYVDQVLAAADRAAEVTRSLLAFSRKQIMNPRSININDIIGKVEQLLTRLIGADIDVNTILTCPDARSIVDAGQIEQVLMNLATNARDAMPKGGRFTISTEIINIDNSFVVSHGCGNPGKYVLIAVSDTGIGMNQETMAKIFEPFFTTKEPAKGTGLGLAMVYGIVNQHGGFINVYSEPDKGTTFRIYLPATESKEEVPDKTTIGQQLIGGTETILVAEDDEKLRNLYETVLTQYGYEVILAQDGEEAINKFLGNKDSIQLVLLDMVMPKKNGKAVYEEIRRIKPQTKILFLSGYTADRIDKEMMLKDKVNLINKPVSPKNLLWKLRATLDV